MNYRHIYHAGGFADIVKHLVFVELILHLKKKQKPFAVLDCFAGSGSYNINSVNALKTGESRHGIGKISDFMVNANQPPPYLLDYYLKIIKNAGKDIYPGSPLIVKNLLRNGDELIATELHPEDCTKLKSLFRNQNNIHIHHMNGYLSAKAFLPFKQKRGLIFIDPAFELPDEFGKIINLLKIIKQRSFSSPVLIWYPLKDSKKVEKFYEDCTKLLFNEIIKIEFFVMANFQKNSLNKTDAMSKCGLLIFNPPDILSSIKENLDFIIANIYHNEAAYSIKSYQKSLL